MGNTCDHVCDPARKVSPAASQKLRAPVLNEETAQPSPAMLAGAPSQPGEWPLTALRGHSIPEPRLAAAGGPAARAKQTLDRDFLLGAGSPEQQRTGRNFASMNERELAEICGRHGWELLGSSPL
jgi:hypothetical protein